MIKSIAIKNIALIEDVEIEFFAGLNVITGETGAGKSILLNAIGLVIGEKISSSIVREGEQKGSVEVLFDVFRNLKLKSKIEESGIEIEENSLIIKRDLNRDNSRSRSFINLNSVPNSSLKTFSEFLLDISGQHEHQSLLRVKTHIDLLDNFGNLKQQRNDFAKLFNELKQLKTELQELSADEAEKEKFLEMTRYAIDEINKNNLLINEDDELEKELKALSNFEKLNHSLEMSYQYLYDEEKSIIPTTEQALSNLESVTQFDPKLEKACNDLRESLYLLENVRDVIRSYKEELEYSPERVEEINQRLEIITDLKRKYGESIQAILAHKTKSEADVEKVSYDKSRIEELKSKEKQLEEKVNKMAINLSKVRQIKAKELEKELTQELAFLAMEKALLKVEFRYVQDENSFLKIAGKGVKIEEKGIDRVELTFSANPGEVPKPLGKIASGGELSRVMLAIKTILTEMDEIDTLLFDEVDAGIGGETAVKVGKKIKSLSIKRQVLCITHSPQIASQSNHHYLVEKCEETGRTKTVIRKLNDDEKVQEIARMIGGEDITELSLKHAEQLIAKS